MLAINGADNPQEQLAALDKFAKEHADSKFMPCANEYYASVNLKLKDYDKSIEYAEKDLAANYQDLNLLLTLMRAYASSTKVSDTIFDGHQQSSGPGQGGDRHSHAACQGHRRGVGKDSER